MSINWNLFVEDLPDTSEVSYNATAIITSNIFYYKKSYKTHAVTYVIRVEHVANSVVKFRMLYCDLTSLIGNYYTYGINSELMQNFKFVCTESLLDQFKCRLKI